MSPSILLSGVRFVVLCGFSFLSAGSSFAQNAVEARNHEILATGLTPVFPPGFSCEGISSPFGSSTRHDGSYRRGDRNSGLHGGLDISLKEGTPLLAVAAGEVIAKGEGGRLEGIFLWTRHSPEDTGLPFWTFAKYQHLSALPLLSVGDPLAAGQIVAPSGSTGTAGGHYGAGGYAHLHLTTFYAPSPKFSILGAFHSMVKGQDSEMGDPMILYLREIPDPKHAHALPADKKLISTPVMGSDRVIYPLGSKTIWPVSCSRN
jgi:hypothetical protein